MTYINKPALLPTNYDDLRHKLRMATDKHPNTGAGYALARTYGMPAELEAEIRYDALSMSEVYGKVIHYCLRNVIAMKEL